MNNTFCHLPGCYNLVAPSSRQRLYCCPHHQAKVRHKRHYKPHPGVRRVIVRQAIIEDETVRIPLTKGYWVVVDKDAYDSLSLLRDGNWHITFGRSKKGYAVKDLPLGNGRYRKLALHRYIMGDPAGAEIDHINRNTLDCRRSNLRLSSRYGNNRNATKPKRNAASSSKYRGVRWRRAKHKWEARIMANWKRYRLGYFDSEKDAAIAYNDAAIRLHGAFAILNPI